MSTYRTDPRIDEYIESLPDWQQEICRQVRDLVHAADPDVIETIKRTRQPYFTLDGNICALLGTKATSTCSSTTPSRQIPRASSTRGMAT